MLLALWEVAYKTFVDILNIWKPYNFPSPFGVAIVFIDLIKDGTLFIGITSSFSRVLLSYLLSLVIGLPLGIIIAKFKYLSENLNPLILGFQTLPSICWVPFAILWYGLNDNAVYFIVIISSVFAVCISTVSGILNINPIYKKAAKTLGAKDIRLYLHVILPASIPGIISGIKQGWSFAWRGLMAGEMMVATKGLGQILMMGRELSDINQVFAIMIVIIILGSVIERFVFNTIEEKIRFRWGLH
jgi:NitT/TauT family transport system permease protein